MTLNNNIVCLYIDCDHGQLHLHLYLLCICMLIVTIDRNVLGTLNLGDILSQRESIAREMQVLSSARQTKK